MADKEAIVLLADKLETMAAQAEMALLVEPVVKWVGLAVVSVVVVMGKDGTAARRLAVVEQPFGLLCVAIQLALVVLLLGKTAKAAQPMV